MEGNLTPEEKVNTDKCVICGEKVGGLELLCEWCGGKERKEPFFAFWEILQNEIDTYSTIPLEEPVISLTKDIGAFASDHLYLKVLKRIIGNIISHIHHREWSINREDLLNTGRRANWVLPLIEELGLLEAETNEKGMIHAYSIVQEPIVKNLSSTLQMKGDTTRSKRQYSNFLFGYLLLGIIRNTLNIIEKRNNIQYGEGVPALSPINSNTGSLMLPKSRTVPVMFIFGQWTARPDFSEFDLREFAKSRGIYGEKYEKIRRFIAGDYPGVEEGLITTKIQNIGGKNIELFHFKYENLRERVRERMRERERERE